MRFAPPADAAALLAEVQSIFWAFFIVIVLLGIAWYVHEYECARREAFLKSDRSLKLRYEQWKKDQQNPPRHTPPTE